MILNINKTNYVSQTTSSMKKYFSLMAGIILLLFTACQNDELVKMGDGSEVAVSFNVQMQEGNSPSTRAAAAGDGTTVNRCIMEIYLNGELYGERQITTITSKGAKFDVRLVTSQTYDFVFWADNVTSTEGDAIKTDNHYATTNAGGLQNITYVGTYTGNDETRDAFFGTLTNELVTGAFTKSVELKRPFGQLNIKTNEIKSILKADLKPVSASLSFKNVYTAFNALNGNLIGNTTTLDYGQAVALPDDTGTLTMDYLFAPASDKLLANMVLTVNNASKTQITTKELNSIPIQRNYKTNVSGNLLTVSGSMNISVVPDFAKDDISEEIAEVSTVADVAEALKTSDNVVVKTAPTADATISLPKYTATDKSVSITLPAQTTSTVTINYTTETSTGGNPPKELTINAPEATKLVIDATQTTVYLNGKTYETVEAGTAPNTLVVNDGVTVSSLKVNAGNVKIVGTGKVSAITKDDKLTDIVYIIASNSSQYPANLGAGFEVVASEEVANMKIAFTKGQEYKLTADADITGANVKVPAGKNATLDLNGYTITADNSDSGKLRVSGTLTLRDSKGGGKIVASKDYGSGCTSALVYVSGDNAKMIMESGTIYAVRNPGQFGVSVYEGADFTMTGGRIEAGYYAVSGNGNDNDASKESVIEIKGGELISTADYAVYLPHVGTTNISGGKVNGAAGGVCIKRGILNISDTANILSQGDGDTGNWGDGTGGLGNSALCVVAEYGDCTVNISGGTFAAVKDAVFISKEFDHNKKNISVSGGTFSDPSMFGYLAEKANVKVKFTKDYEGPGLGIFNEGTKNGKEAKIEVDLNNHAWILNGEPLFGSPGTVNQFFHFEKGAAVTFKNGTIKPKTGVSASFVIQNYCDLTLENVELIGGSTCKYVVSNNNGSCNITGSTLTASAGECALDVFAQNAYPDGVTVTVNNGSTINGRVEFGGDSGLKISKFIVNGGTFNGNLVVEADNYDSVNKNIIINGGEFGKYTGWSDYK